RRLLVLLTFFSFTHTSTSEIYTLSLHDALPIWEFLTLGEVRELFAYNAWANRRFFAALEPLPTESYFRDLKSSHGGLHGTLCHRSEEHTSELQSLAYLVCRLLLEKKKRKHNQVQ